MSKNNSTSTEGRVPDAHATLADHMAAIISNPDTPKAIKDALIDSLNELSFETQITHNTPEVLRVALPLMLERLQRQGGADTPHREVNPPSDASAPDQPVTPPAQRAGSSGAGTPDALARMQAWMQRPDHDAEVKLTIDEAAELAESIAGRFDDDVMT